MKAFLIFLILLLTHCFPKEKTDSIKIPIEKKEYAAGENIDVYNRINGEIIFTIEEGEIFLKETIPENKDWEKIYLEDKSGFIPKNKRFYLILNEKTNFLEELFLTHFQKGTPFCKKPSREYRCPEKIKTLPHLEKLQFKKIFVMYGSGTWLQVENDGLVGFVHQSDVIPERIFRFDQVEMFKKKFQEICATKAAYISKNTSLCYSVKQFQNGDGNETWKERVYFSIDKFSSQFGYGRKYVETDGLIYDVATIGQNRFQVSYLDLEDYSQNSFLVEINVDKKTIISPMPETLMKGTYKQELSERLEFKNGLSYFK